MQPEAIATFWSNLCRKKGVNSDPLIYKTHADQYLLDEVSHFHLRPLLRHVGLHLRVRVVDDGQEHVLYRNKINGYVCF